MRRREFIATLGGAALWPVAAKAQATGKIPVIGILWHGSLERELVNPFYHYVHDGLANHGYVAGKTVRYEERYADERLELYDQYADELVKLNPDLLMALNVAAALVLKKATKTIPIVSIGVSDPVALGLVDSMAKPGGNITGMANVGRETYIKRVQILKQLVPSLSRLALLAALEEPQQVKIEQDHYSAAAVANGVELEVFGARDVASINKAFADIAARRCEGVVISQQGIFYLYRDELARAAIANGLPAMGPGEPFVPSGLLVAYSPEIKSRFAEYVQIAVRILRGAKPADLPILFPTHIRLGINARTAAALNLSVPPELLATADHVYE